MSAESAGNLHAKNPRSSATGLFQFIDATWEQYGNGKSIYDPYAQIDAVVRFTAANKAVLEKTLNRAPTVGEYYLAHFAGAGGARQILENHPETPIKGILGQKVLDMNEPIRFRGKKFADFTAGDLRNWADTRMSVDRDARKAYTGIWKTGSKTQAENEIELDTRRKILEDFGYDSKTIEDIGLGKLLGDLFIAIIDALMEESAPPAERRSMLPPRQFVDNAGLPNLRSSQQRV